MTTTAERLRVLSFSIEQEARELRAFAEMLLRGEVPERAALMRVAAVVTALAHDAGEAAGLAGRTEIATIDDKSAALVLEVEEGDDPPARDPPGRPTPGERPSTRSKLP